MIKTKILVVLSFTIIALPAYSKMYKCVDSSGAVTYQQAKCSKNAREKNIEGDVRESIPSFGTGSRNSTARYKKALELQRDSKALRLGITREKLDRIEGRAVQGTKNLKILDWTHHKSGSGSYIYVKGVVKNYGTGPAEFVTIVAKGLDITGKLKALEKAIVSPRMLAPRTEGTFEMMFPSNLEIEKFNLSIESD